MTTKDEGSLIMMVKTLTFSVEQSRMCSKYVYAILLFALTATTSAQNYSAGSLRLTRPTADESRAGQQAIGVYLEIQNDAAHADRLVAVISSIAENAVLHQLAAGSSHMASARYLTLPGKSSLVLAPGGSHIMLTGLRQSLRNGDRFPLKLVFERSGAVLVDVLVVRPVTTQRAHHH